MMDQNNHIDAATIVHSTLENVVDFEFLFTYQKNVNDPKEVHERQNTKIGIIKKSI